MNEVEALVKNVLIREDSTTVLSVEPSSSGDYCSVVLDGDVMLETLRVLANRTWVTELDFPVKPSHWAYVPQKVVNLADSIIRQKQED